MQRTDNIRVAGEFPIPSPRQLKTELPITEQAAGTVLFARQTIERIIAGEDQRLLAIVGPCSIHDPAAAREYAGHLKQLADEAADRLFMVMRVYFEKPRTTTGWKGLISDPRLDGTDDIEAGLRIARQLLLDINELGLPTATEFLDPTVPQFISDLVSWAAIGARTTESQTHREMASGLSMPIGFKNSTGGDVQVAINAMLSARVAHSFLGIDQDGRQCQVKTTGNPHGHLVLRGGKNGPNCDEQNIALACSAIKATGLKPAIVVDCSHDNGYVKPAAERAVWQNPRPRQAGREKDQASAWVHTLAQRHSGQNCVIGAMLESNLEAGKQGVNGGSSLLYGVSITDECIGWEETAELLRL